MAGDEDPFDILGRLGELGGEGAAEVLSKAIPDMLKGVVESGSGFEFLVEPLREAVAGLGGLSGLGELLGPGILKVLGELSGPVTDVLDIGGGTDIAELVTRSMEALQQFNPSKDD